MLRRTRTAVATAVAVIAVSVTPAAHAQPNTGAFDSSFEGLVKTVRDVQICGAYYTEVQTWSRFVRLLQADPLARDAAGEDVYEAAQAEVEDLLEEAADFGCPFAQ